MQADLTMGNLASALTFHTHEAALIDELQAGSEEAFAWLITRYHQPIYSLLARSVQDRADAADLTQEVVAAHLDLPHRVARGLEPEALLDEAQAAGGSH
jgi:DNA-directed RNA polymerase specialized sigma24 family protein